MAIRTKRALYYLYPEPSIRYAEDPEHLMAGTVVISARGEERLRSGHPWIYRGDLADVRAEPGDMVLVRSTRNRALGLALYSSRSQIAIRMIARGPVDGQPAVEEIL